MKLWRNGTGFQGDRSTLIGLGISVVIVAGTIALSPARHSFWNPTAAFIIVGGILATTLIRFPMSVVFTSLPVLKRAFLNRMTSQVELVESIVLMADMVRRESVLAMERHETRDSFLKRGVELCVDGVDPDTVEAILRTEAATILERSDRGQRILRGIGNSCPAFGMIGTLIGLVEMLTRLDDPSKIGGAMAIAMLTTLYGAFLAYLFFLPLADKLVERSHQERVNGELVIQGLRSILSGHHPRLVEARLLGLLEPSLQFHPKRRPRRRVVGEE